VRKISIGVDAIIDNIDTKIKTKIKSVISYSIGFIPYLVYILLKQSPNYPSSLFTDMVAVTITLFLLFMRYKTGGWN
jgi:hypothetical protein